MQVNFQDHPRIRGENTEVEDFAETMGGSPPHTRGKRSPSEQNGQWIGITPAYAGKTFFDLKRVTNI